MKLDYTVKFSARKTLRITVERDRSITVNAPAGMSRELIHREIEKRKLWIYQKSLHPRKDSEHGKTTKKYEAGSALLYLGNVYTLVVTRDDFDGIRFDSNFFISENYLRKADQLLEDWYKARAEESIVPRVSYHAKNLGVKYKSIKIGSMRYRWGSCSKAGNLSFNFNLIKAPMSVIDYIILHELAHTFESGHGKAFWQLIKTQCPDYINAKEWLKTFGGTILED